MTQGPRGGTRASREGRPGPGQHPRAYSAGNSWCGGGERREVRKGGKPAKGLRPSLVQCDRIWTHLQPQNLFLNKGHSRALGAHAGLRDTIHPVWELGPKVGASICLPMRPVCKRDLLMTEPPGGPGARTRGTCPFHSCPRTGAGGSGIIGDPKGPWPGTSLGEKRRPQCHREPHFRATSQKEHFRGSGPHTFYFWWVILQPEFCVTRAPQMLGDKQRLLFTWVDRTSSGHGWPVVRDLKGRASLCSIVLGDAHGGYCSFSSPLKDAYSVSTRGPLSVSLPCLLPTPVPHLARWREKSALACGGGIGTAHAFRGNKVWSGKVRQEWP